MLSRQEKEIFEKILKETRDENRPIITEAVHLLIDGNRIEDIPEALDAYVSSAEVDTVHLRQYVFANVIAGAILNRYIQKKVGERVQYPAEAVNAWVIRRGESYATDLEVGMSDGGKLKAIADGMVEEVIRDAEGAAK